MSNIVLTKDGDYLLCVCYKKYLQNKRLNKSLAETKKAGTYYEIHDLLIPEKSVDDIREISQELITKNLMEYPNIRGDLIFTSDGIIYMENRFKNKIENVVDYIIKIKSIIF